MLVDLCDTSQQWEVVETKYRLLREYSLYVTWPRHMQSNDSTATMFKAHRRSLSSEKSALCASFVFGIQ